MNPQNTNEATLLISPGLSGESGFFTTRSSDLHATPLSTSQRRIHSVTSYSLSFVLRLFAPRSEGGGTSHGRLARLSFLVRRTAELFVRLMLYVRSSRSVNPFKAFRKYRHREEARSPFPNKLLISLLGTDKLLSTGKWCALKHERRIYAVRAPPLNERTP
jgi:hypothetical protein